jgi:hypothetical protein
MSPQMRLRNGVDRCVARAMSDGMTRKHIGDVLTYADKELNRSFVGDPKVQELPFPKAKKQ